MSNIHLIIEERAADIGNFLVGRILPFRKKQIPDQAKADWKNQNLEAFPKIPGDENDFIPLPE